MKFISRNNTGLSYLLLLWSVSFLPSAIVSADNNTDGSNPCRVWNENGEDVTIEVYDETLQLVNCTGSHSCFGYEMSHCPNLYCTGLEACNSARIWNLTGNVQCLEKHACHHTEIHAVPPEKKDDSPKSNVECIGISACDVAIMTNMNQVLCNGPHSCRKARIHASMVQCDKGGPIYEACGSSATFIVKDCLMCGTEMGCAHIHGMCQYRLSEEEVAVDYFNSTSWGVDPWDSCPLNDIVGTCPSEWTTQFEEEGMENEANQESTEEGS